MIMLHGAMQTFHLSFDALLPELTGDRQVIGAELPGHGHTADRNGTFSIGQCAADVVALLDHLNIDRAGFFDCSPSGRPSAQEGIAPACYAEIFDESQSP